MKKPILKKSYDRILEISEDCRQITLPDSRYYLRHGKYYPSITYVLSAFPKGKYYENWLKDHGHTSEYIAKKSAEEGTQVHQLIEDYLDGKDINFLGTNDVPLYQVHVWQMFLRFVEFWDTYKPTLIESEVHLFSDRLQIAGTCDMVCELEFNGKKELWIIDFKTSNHLNTSYDLQLACYAECYEECFGKKADRVGVLWLKSSSRGEDKKGKTPKGKNWEIYESPRSQSENMELFKCTKTLFDLENPKHKPFSSKFPTFAKRSV